MQRKSNNRYTVQAKFAARKAPLSPHIYYTITQYTVTLNERDSNRGRLPYRPRAFTIESLFIKFVNSVFIKSQQGNILLKTCRL